MCIITCYALYIICIYICLCISIMNSSNNTRGRREKLLLFGYYKVPAVSVKLYMLFECELELVVNAYYISRETTEKVQKEV